MKTLAKLTLIILISGLFFSYSTAQKIPKDSNIKEKNKISNTQLKSLNDTNKNKPPQKSGGKIACELESGFVDKINRVKGYCTEKTNILKRLDTSLNGIIPLVKNTTIKTDLQNKQRDIQTMIKNYADLKARLETNPQSTCGGQKTPVWKTYNEETKVMIKNIRTQLNLLKTKKK